MRHIVQGNVLGELLQQVPNDFLRAHGDSVSCRRWNFQFVRNRLHVGLGGRIENRQAQRRDGDEARTEVVEVVLDGLELAGHFARGQRALPSTGWGVAKNHTRYAHRHRY